VGSRKGVRMEMGIWQQEEGVGEEESGSGEP